MLACAIALGACRSGEPVPGAAAGTADEGTFEERLDALLAKGPEGGYGQTEACLGLWQFASINVVSEKVLLFSDRDSYWVNQLAHPCAGLQRNMMVNILTRGVESLCSGDDVYANYQRDLKDGLAPSGRPLQVRATCTLGEFRKVPASYGQSLKALKP